MTTNSISLQVSWLYGDSGRIIIVILCSLFGSTDNDSYRVHVKSHTKKKVFMGEQMECCLIEKWCDYKINGVNGWGAAEWQYRT